MRKGVPERAAAHDISGSGSKVNWSLLFYRTVKLPTLALLILNVKNSKVTHGRGSDHNDSVFFLTVFQSLN